MAKPSKAADLRSLSDEDIEKQVYDCKKALLDMRIAQASRKVRKGAGNNSQRSKQTCSN